MKPYLHPKDLWIFIVTFLIVCVIWYFSQAWVAASVDPKIFPSELAALKGQFGDQFGAVNSLFSGLAFAGIIITILLQRRDLKETTAAMTHERFDNTFFQLLSVHISLTEKTSIFGHTGRRAFRAFNEILRATDSDFPIYIALKHLTREDIKTIQETGIVDKSTYPILTDEDIANITEALNGRKRAFDNYLDQTPKFQELKIQSACVKINEQYIDDVSHYFRNLYHILKFIDEAKNVSAEDKKRYSRFLRAQLSQDELISIFYNSIVPIKIHGREDLELGHPKMRNLIIKYDLIQNMSPTGLIHRDHLDIFNKEHKGT